MYENDALLQKHTNLRYGKWSKSVIEKEAVCSDYPDNFSWRQLFHKLCFEQMLSNISITCDFKLMYEFINKIGAEIPVLRVATIDKTKLKSN